MIWEIVTSGSNANLNRVTASFFKGDGSAVTGIISSSYSVSSSWAPASTESDPIFVRSSGSLATTGSNTFIGNQIITGSVLLSTGSRMGVGIQNTPQGIMHAQASASSTPVILAVFSGSEPPLLSLEDGTNPSGTNTLSGFRILSGGGGSLAAGQVGLFIRRNNVWGNWVTWSSSGGGVTNNWNFPANTTWLFSAAATNEGLSYSTSIGTTNGVLGVRGVAGSSRVVFGPQYAGTYSSSVAIVVDHIADKNSYISFRKGSNNINGGGTELVKITNDGAVIINKSAILESIYKLGVYGDASVSGSLHVTGSIVASGVSGSFSGSFSGNGNGLTNLISASYSISSSNAATSSFNTSIFSRGATYFVSGGLSSRPEVFTIWRTPYPCRVVSVMGWADRASCFINTRKSSSSGWSAHTTSFQMLSNNDWTVANSVVNTDYSANETLQIMVTGSGEGESRVTVQVNFIRI